MKIASSDLQLAASHTATRQHEVRESLRLWVGPPPQTPPSPRPSPAGDRVSLSEAGLAAQSAQSAPSAEAEAIEQGLDEADHDPRLQLLRAMIYLLTGQEARVFDAGELEPVEPVALPDAAPPPANSAAPANRPAGYGVEYDYHETYDEFEQADFSANGVIRTADGQEIRFDLALSMTRRYHEESNVSLRLGDAARPKKDPLVLNFAGSAAQLASQRFAFDLDADGQTESINRLAGGSAFLALDRNGDGRINDGSELFGATSGDGFADLAALDDDGNGWIDEADAAYSRLRLWVPDAAGNGSLRGLRETSVGALSLARVATPFELRDGNNASLGQIRSSSVFLQESGSAGTIHQIDLSV
jgi:hypothetical protein